MEENTLLFCINFILCNISQFLNILFSDYFYFSWFVFFLSLNTSVDGLK